MVAADAVRRQLGSPEPVIVPVATADLAAQWAVERELAREGLDRRTVASDEIGVRARAIEADVLARLEEQLAALTVEARLTEPSVPDVRSAFVRLYDQGAVIQAELLVRVCPRCAAVVQRHEIERAGAEAQVLTIALGSVEIDLLEVELLPGVIAVAVPPGDPAAGMTLTVPLAGRDVPVLA